MTNKTYTKKSDVYSFAIAAWEVLTRETPFAGTDPIDAQIKIVKQNKRPPQMNIPDDIYLLLNKCWDLNPENRPDLTDVVLELNSKLYKYRLLAKGHSLQRSGGGISSGSSIAGPTSIYSAPSLLQPMQSNSTNRGNDTPHAFKRPSLVPDKYNVSHHFRRKIQRFSSIVTSTDNSYSNPNNPNTNPPQNPIHGLRHQMSIPPNLPSLLNRNRNTALHTYKHTQNPGLTPDMRRVSGPIQQQYVKLPQSHPQLQYHYTYNGPSATQNPPNSSAPNPTVGINMKINPNNSPVSRSSQRLRHHSPPPMPLSSPNPSTHRNSKVSVNTNPAVGQNNANSHKLNSSTNNNNNNKPGNVDTIATRNSAASPPPFVSPSPSNNPPVSYNGSKTVPMYSQSDYLTSSISALSPNAAPPQPISPPPNNYNVASSAQQIQQIINPANIILENINSQSVIQ